MENKMMMPACYSVMTEDEMTYTSGGDAGTFPHTFYTLAQDEGKDDGRCD